jgi:hypothetical protein
MITKHFHAYRSEGWGGGSYHLGLRFWRLELSFRWKIWTPKATKVRT